MTAPLAIGTRLGKLVLVAHAEPPKFGPREAWSLWACDCGKQKKIRTRAVISGGTRSCGCVGRNAMRGLLNAHYAEIVASARGRR